MFNHTLVSATISESFLKYSGFQHYESQPRPVFTLDVYPLNWLSVGAYYSFHQSISEISGSKYKTTGGRLAFHAYPVFKWTKLNYFKDHVDVYLAANVQQDITEYLTYTDYDPETWEKIVLDKPVVFRQNHLYTGFSLGLSYYVIKNVGVNIEYSKIGYSFSYTEYLKAGIIFRL